VFEKKIAPLHAGEIWKRDNNRGHFGFVFEKKIASHHAGEI